MNWLITGGCGFLGTSIIKRLIRQNGHSIRVIDNFTVGNLDDLGLVCEFNSIDVDECLVGYSNQRVQVVKGDILDADLALRVTHDTDVIVHLAANTGVGPSVENPRDDMQANVIGTFNYLEAARINKCPRFVFASSGAPVGEVTPPIHEELPPHPVSPYGASKLAGEGYCSAYNRTFGIDTVMLRFGNVYGPGSLHKNSVVSKFIRQAMNGETLEIFGDGSQTRDFVYIDDLVEAIILAATTSSIGGETFQIATNNETTVGELAEMLVDVLMSNGIGGVQLLNTEQRLGDVQRNYSDTSKAMHKLGWEAKVRLYDGLQKTVEYFLK